MRYLSIFLLCLVFAFNSTGQVSSLSEDFDATCSAGGSGYPGGWIEYNNIPIIDSMKWKCTSTLGRWGTPGMRCLGYYDGAYHLDTSWLFTPALNLYSYSDSVFLRFDSKFEVGTPVGVHKSTLNIFVFRSLDTSFLIPVVANPDTDLSLALVPVIGPGDSAGWVTHEVNLTGFTSTTIPPIRVAFRYVSTDVDAGAWTLDNINLTPISLKSSNLGNLNHNLNIIGSKCDQGILLKYTVPASGYYDLALTDMNGRTVLKQSVYLTEGTGNYTLNCGSLNSGIYSLQAWNGQYHSTTKLAAY